MKTYITILFLGGSMLNGLAQTTAIPDPLFEQALINMGIDSDQTVNGQVLTSDIAIVETLDLNDVGIEDLTGIEDFTSLKVLDISHSGLHDNPTLDLSMLSNLEEIYLNADDDNATLEVTYLDLSNNPNLKKIQSNNNWNLETIDLKGSDLQLNNLEIDIHKGINDNTCIQVTDPAQADNGQGVYATWNACCDIVFSANCNLGVTDHRDRENKLSIYPNPAIQSFQIETPETIQNLDIYNLQGKLVKNYIKPQKNYSVVGLAKGIYLLQLQTLQGEKFIKKLLVE